MSVGATGERLVRDRKVLREAERAAEEEQPRSDRQLRVPTSVLLTLLVAVLSVLVGPAFARQWEDRQNARDLKAVIADEIAAATARTVGAGVDVARAERAQVRRHRVVNARAFWVPASLRIETKLRAYFPASMATEWERLVSDVDDFLVNVCANAAPPGQALASNLTDDDRRANIAGLNTCRDVSRCQGAFVSSLSARSPVPPRVTTRKPVLASSRMAAPGCSRGRMK
jgi:hypothetical protein